MLHKSNIKVKFKDPQLDDYVLENSVLKSKLQSKIDALTIVSKELDKCSMERDRYKILVEQLNCSKNIILESTENDRIYRFAPTNTISGGDMLAKTKDHNNILKLEVETLRSKLEEAQGDVLALKKQLQKDSLENLNESRKRDSLSYSSPEYEQLVQQLEKVQKKYHQMQLDYRATLDEKEELVLDRDYYKNKVQRLNHQISYILSNRLAPQNVDNETDPPKPIMDIDALITENKYLHERITQLEIEKELIRRNLIKYKTLLENRNNKNEKFNFKKGFGDVMTQKQVRELLDVNSKTSLKRTSAAELKSLCLGLFEALNDKSIALQHQRKTNQILANRITELEKTLDSWCKGQKYFPTFPSQMLLEEMLPDSCSPRHQDLKRSKKKTNTDKENSFSDSDEGNKENSNESDQRGSGDFADTTATASLTTKTVLPQELEELVKEALAEMKPKD